MEIGQPFYFIQLIISAFVAVLFIQSGLDKVFDWKGNLGWLKGHFEKTPLKNMIPLALGVITLIEVSAGLLSATGFVLHIIGETEFAIEIIGYGLKVAAIGLTMLFAGQRIAKDYTGAASLVPYFILVIIGLLFIQV